MQGPGGRGGGGWEPTPGEAAVRCSLLPVAGESTLLLLWEKHPAAGALWLWVGLLERPLAGLLLATAPCGPELPGNVDTHGVDRMGVPHMESMLTLSVLEDMQSISTLGVLSLPQGGAWGQDGVSPHLA